MILILNFIGLYTGLCMLLFGCGLTNYSIDNHWIRFRTLLFFAGVVMAMIGLILTYGFGKLIYGI